jgi:hypothetical protein
MDGWMDGCQVRQLSPAVPCAVTALPTLSHFASPDVTELCAYLDSGEGQRTQAPAYERWNTSFFIIFMVDAA